MAEITAKDKLEAFLKENKIIVQSSIVSVREVKDGSLIIDAPVIRVYYEDEANAPVVKKTN